MTFSPKTGTTLGRYQLLCRWSTRNHWVALEDRPGEAGRLVVLRMHAGLANQQEVVSQVAGLARSLALVKHDNVALPLEVSRHEDVLCIASTWTFGETLGGVLMQVARGVRIPIEIGVRVIADAAKGLEECLRQAGVGTITPHSVTIGLDGRVRVSESSLIDVLPRDQSVGDEGYLSPEQARGQAVDERSDVFALGVMLFELTTGRRLFAGEDAHHTLGLVMRCQVPTPSSVRSGYPPALESILLSALQDKPDARMGSVSALRTALERYLVSERTLVSAGSISSFLVRVAGERLAGRHQALSDALVRTQGDAALALLGEMPALSGIAAPPEEAMFPDRGSVAPPGSSASAVVLAPTASSASSHQGGPARLPPLVWGILAAAGVFVAMLALGRLKGPSLGPQETEEEIILATPAQELGVPVQGSPGPAKDRKGADLKVDDLPVEKKRPRWGGSPAVAPQPASPSPVAPSPDSPEPAADDAPSPAPAPNWLREAEGAGTELDPQQAPPVETPGPAPAKSAEDDQAPLDKPPPKKIDNPYLTVPSE